MDLRIEPQEAGKGFEFENDEIVGGVIPKGIYVILQLKKGVKEQMQNGVIGWIIHVVDVKVTALRWFITMMLIPVKWLLKLRVPCAC